MFNSEKGRVGKGLEFYKEMGEKSWSRVVVLI